MNELRSRQDTYRALHAATGGRLFTVTVIDRAAGLARRVYTSHPDTYPVSGTKPIQPNDTEWLTARLVHLFTQHEALDQAFQFASSTLDHEGFRAFSEAYKSAREMVEREIEERQRRFSSIYVDAVVKIMTKSATVDSNLSALSHRLDTLFFEAGETLTQEDIFSRESFQTVTEAYDIARETIERKKREQRRQPSTSSHSSANIQNS